MFASPVAESLYRVTPTKLLQCEHGVWYAFYDEELTILSNSLEKVDAYEFKTKAEYREQRHLVIFRYPGRVSSPQAYDGYYNNITE